MDKTEAEIERITAEAERFCPDGNIDLIDYGEFGIWRWTHKVHKDPGGMTTRCPRCYSTKVVTKPPLITCRGCRYSENLIDFAVAGR